MRNSLLRADGHTPVTADDMMRTREGRHSGLNKVISAEELNEAARSVLR